MMVAEASDRETARGQGAHVRIVYICDWLPPDYGAVGQAASCLRTSWRKPATTSCWADCRVRLTPKQHPISKLAIDRDPDQGSGLDRILFSIDLYRRGYAMPPMRIVLDIDDTSDMVHGGQQLALFNMHAGGHCFQPTQIFEAARDNRRLHQD